MERKNWFLGIGTVLIVSLTAMAFMSPSDSAKKARQAIALRYIGDQLLRQHGDSTTRILPIEETDSNEFTMRFGKPFAFVADSLVNLFRHQAEIKTIPQHFSVEVIDVHTKLTAYAFAFPSRELPCLGRPNPKKDYEIQVNFREETDLPAVWFAGIPFALFFLVLGTRNKPKPDPEKNDDQDFIQIGKYRFYPNSSHLTLNGRTIDLTAKESSVLHIFATRPNQVVEREILQKEVWENQGVIVGRSLDVFISRLRKKLSEDENLKIISLHGTGYKLVIATQA